MRLKNLLIISTVLTLFCVTKVCAKDPSQKSSSQIDVVSNPKDRSAEAFCEDISHTINILVPYTTTLCAPAKGTRKGSLSLLY